MSVLSRCRLHLIAFILLVIAVGHPAFATIDIDHTPPMRWNEMLGCQMIILATYQSHQGKTLSLKVVSVLRGSGLKAGDVVTVTLENRYCMNSEELGPDFVPQLCYQTLNDTRIGTMPSPILADARQPAIYFFPQAGAPILARPGQVQSAVLIDGWQKAIGGQPMPLTFRLGQTVSPALQRDALEELYLSRDPAVLGILFTWIFNRPQPQIADAQAQLTAIGDRNGDVYGRALQLHLHSPLLPEQSGWLKPADEISQIMAQVDPHRALQEFRSESRSNDPKVNKTAFAWADFCGTEEALNLGFDLLKNQHTTEDGISLLSNMLSPGTHWPQPHFPADKLAFLQESARPRLLAALSSPSLTDAQKKEAWVDFRLIIGQPPKVNIAHAESLLIHPTLESSNYSVLQDIQRASDPKLIPLLVQTISYRPSMMEESAFTNVLIYYAHLCPHNMQRQLAVEGIDLTKSPHSGVWPQFEEALGEPQPPALIQELVAGTGLPDGNNVETDYLHALLQFAPQTGIPLLQQALAKRIQYDPYTQAELLSMAFEYLPDPDPTYLSELRDILIVADDKSLEKVRQEQTDSAQDVIGFRGVFHHDGVWDVTSLPSFASAPILQEYLRFVDALKPLDTTRYASEVAALCRRHPADGFPRVLALLESPSLPDRAAGEGAVVTCLHWDFGFQSADFAAQRDTELAALRPWLKKYAFYTETQMRADVLGSQGIMVSSAPSREWLPTLSLAALRFDPAISQNAFDLIEDITGEPDLNDLRQESPDIRRAMLSAFYADRGITVNGF